MHKPNFGKTLTHEEQLLVQKYKLLREKREQVKKLSQTATSIHPFPEQKGNGSQTPSMDAAKEKAKRLLLSGKITIAQQERKSGFKRAKILERKLSEGQRSTDPKLPPPPPPGGLMESSAKSPQQDSRETGCQLKGFHGASSSGRAESLDMPLLSSSSSVAGSESDWRSSIQNERFKRHQGNYYDHKRRAVVYSSESSDDD